MADLAAGTASPSTCDSSVVCDQGMNLTMIGGLFSAAFSADAASELALAAARIARLNARANSTRKGRRDYVAELDGLEGHVAQARAQAERE